MTTPTPSPEAEALPTLPVVAWRRFSGFTGWHFWGDEQAEPGSPDAQDLTPRAPAEAAIVALRAERDEAKRQMGVACTEQLFLRAEVAELRKDAQRYQWLRSLTVGYRDENNAKRFRLPNIESGADIMRGSVAQHLDAAIDAARASLLGDGGTL